MAFDLFRSRTLPSPKELRPHQIEAIRLVQASFGKGNRRVVCQMPTGAGKTVTAAKLILLAREAGERVIFTAPAISLIDQTVKAFEAEGIDHIGVMQADHPRTDPTAPVQIASVATLARRRNPYADLVVIDECHIQFAHIVEMLKRKSATRFLGLSATPWAKGMGLVWDDLVIPTTIGDLIDAGLLSKFSAFAPHVPDLSGVAVLKGEYSESGLERVMGDAKLMGEVVETWLERGEDRPTLCFGVNRAHADRLRTQFVKAGVSTEYVDGDTDRIERADINRRFENGDVRVICSVRTMTTGVDLPVSCIIDAAPTRSEMLHVQKIGRGLRVNPGTEDCVILDHAGNSLRLGLVTDIKHEALDRTKPGQRQEAKPKAAKLPTPCSKCETLHTGMTCPACGHERKPLGIVPTAQGSLVAVTKVVLPADAEKDRWHAGLVWIAQERGYKPGWAAVKYKERFGDWPKWGANPEPVAPALDITNWIKSRQIAWAKGKARA